MNDRAKAIAILRQTRELLADRLTEWVLEERESILEDAVGLGSDGMIDTIHEQVTVKLSHINQMLANLPSQEDVEENVDDSKESSRHDQPESAPRGPLAIGLKRPTAMTLAPAQRPTFAIFLQQVQGGYNAAAARSLGQLLELPAPEAEAATEWFTSRLAENAQLPWKAIRLRSLLAQGAVNETLMVLWECFGLQGPAAIGVMTTLRRQMRTLEQDTDEQREEADE